MPGRRSAVFFETNGIAAQGIDERVVAVGRAAIELAKGGIPEERPSKIHIDYWVERKKDATPETAEQRVARFV